MGSKAALVWAGKDNLAATIRNLAVRTLADHTQAVYTPAIYTKDTQMHIFKSSSQLVLGAALCLLGITNALAQYEPNDNYSTLVLSYQSSRFAEPVCIGLECHSGVAGPAAIDRKPRTTASNKH